MRKFFVRLNDNRKAYVDYSAMLYFIDAEYMGHICKEYYVSKCASLTVIPDEDVYFFGHLVVSFGFEDDMQNILESVENWDCGEIAHDIFNYIESEKEEIIEDSLDLLIDIIGESADPVEKEKEIDFIASDIVFGKYSANKTTAFAMTNEVIKRYMEL